MSAYYEVKRLYFGHHHNRSNSSGNNYGTNGSRNEDDEILCRDIRLSDLTEEDRSCLPRGPMQLLEEKDRSGRIVTMMFGKLLEDLPLESLARIILYGSQIMTKDEANQMAGYVHIVWAHGMKSNMSAPRALLKTKMLQEVRKCLPIRCVAKHFCYDNPKLDRVLYGALVHGLDAFQVVRTRFHRGSVTECVYNLMTYGISQESIPIVMNTKGKLNTYMMASNKCKHNNDGMIIDTEFHVAFMDAVAEYEEKDRWERERSKFVLTSQLQQTERISRGKPLPDESFDNTEVSDRPSSKTSETAFSSSNKPTLLANQAPAFTTSPTSSFAVLLPGPFDILMGRGCHNRNKPGNLRLKKLLESYREQYDKAVSKSEKTALVQHILMQVGDSGSRFLIQEKPGLWTMASQQRAHDKVAHDFRNMRGRAKAAANGNK